MMEYDFKVKHIKGTSNCTADSLSRLPVCAVGETQAVYPRGTLQQLSELPTMNKVEILCDEEQVMMEVQYLADQPQDTSVCEYSSGY